MNLNATFKLYDSYEHLRTLVSLCHEEEYEEYLCDYPVNPFSDDSRYYPALQHLILTTIADVIAKGSCEDMIEILYFVPKMKGDLFYDTSEILWNH